MECWSTILMLLTGFWLRMYVHYIAQYWLLWVVDANIYRLTPKLYTVSRAHTPHTYLPTTPTTSPHCHSLSQVYLDYTVTNQTALGESMVVLMGVMGNIVFFVFLMMCTYALFRCTATVPDMLSRFLLAYGERVCERERDHF